MKKLVAIALSVFCMLALLAGCSNQEKEIGNINNYTPIALVDDIVVYNYIDDDGTLVIGGYELSSKQQSDIVSVEGFYLSSGKPVVIDNFVILSVTLSTNEHKLLKINADANTSEIIFSEFNSYPMDMVSTMNNDVYMLSSIKDGSITTSCIRKYNKVNANLDICIEKQLVDNIGEQIISFACNNGDIYVLVNGDETDNIPYIEIYDDKNYNLIGKLQFDSELINFVSDNGIVEFYCFDNYIYIRNYSDYGVIGKMENNQIKPYLALPNLRVVYNSKDTKDNYYGFFVRNGEEFYLLDTYTGILYKADLELSQDESIRNAISDGNNICISILDEKDTESFITKKTIMVNFDELQEKAYQTE